MTMFVVENDNEVLAISIACKLVSGNEIILLRTSINSLKSSNIRMKCVSYFIVAVEFLWCSAYDAHLATECYAMQPRQNHGNGILILDT